MARAQNYFMISDSQEPQILSTDKISTVNKVRDENLTTRVTGMDTLQMLMIICVSPL